MRDVLFLHTATRPPLGADTWVHVQIIDRLDRSAHTVHVACVVSTRDGETPTYEAVKSIPGVELLGVDLGPEFAGGSLVDRTRTLVRTLPALPSFVRLWRYVRRNEITVIHTSDRPRDAAVAVVLGRLTGARSVIHAHVGYNETWMSPMLRWSIRQADALIAVSDFVGRTLVAGGMSPSKIHVVRNAIDPTQWLPDADRWVTRDRLGIPRSDVVLLTVCRLFPEKGPGFLIEALALVRRTDPHVRLIVVGQEMTPGYGQELEQLARQLGVDEVVTFLGRREDVDALMAASDIYAMPSFEEPFGLVFLEAMAMERPVVALDNGGTPEVVQHGVTGLLSPPGDLEAFVRNLTSFVRDPIRRSDMGAAGRRRVEMEFSTDAMASETARAYALIDSENRPDSIRPGHSARA